MNEQVLALEQISVEFGATRALNDISLSVARGEVVGLIGHNGAGKTTLFNVLSGVLKPTSGRFMLDDTWISSHLNPHRMMDLGITVIHQDPALIPNLTVLDNIQILHNGIRMSKLRVLAQEALDEVGASCSLDRRIIELTLGEKQLVTLARGLIGRRLKVLLLDEPTAALGRRETDALHQLLRRLSGRGIAIIYVSHRLPDILEVTDRVVVLRSGEVVLDDAAHKFDGVRLAYALAPDLNEVEYHAPLPSAESAYALDHEGRQMPVRPGEVVGLFGMAGGEQFGLLRSAFGLEPGGGLFEGGNRVRATSPRQAISQGIFFVPEDREKEGLASGMASGDAVLLPWYGRDRGSNAWWVSKDSLDEEYVRTRTELAIHGPGRFAPIDEFSGGNRQKHLLGRWMFPRIPKLLMLSQPTQGVDVAAKADIVRGIRALAAQSGTAVYVASSEADEISLMTDRSFVIYEESVAEVPRGENYSARLMDTLLELSGTESTRQGSFT